MRLSQVDMQYLFALFDSLLQYRRWPPLIRLERLDVAIAKRQIFFVCTSPHRAASLWLQARMSVTFSKRHSCDS